MSEGSGLNVAERRRLWRESDRVIRPLKPGNAGRGKDPDFWCAFEEGEVKVIGDKPANTDCDPGPFRESCIVRRRRESCCTEDACGQGFSPCASR